MGAVRKIALLAGGLYLVTFIAGIPPALILYNNVLTNPTYIVGSATDTGLLWGAFLEIINAVACIGTAVVLYPVVKRQSAAPALGFVTARVMEAALIFVGVISLLAIVTMRQDLAGAIGADAASMVTVGGALVAIHDWTSLLGPGLMPAFSALLLGSLMYRSRLVPRVIPMMGLIGAPLLLATATLTIFGITEQFSAVAAIAVIPIFFWELSLGVYMVIKGFRPAAVARLYPTPVVADREPVAV